MEGGGGGGEESKIFRRPSCIKYRKKDWRPFSAFRGVFSSSIVIGSLN